MEQPDHLNYEHLFETLWFAIKYVATLENPLITILVVIVLALNVIHFYKTRTSKEYADKASEIHEPKIFGIPVEHPSVKDALIVFALAIGLIGFLMYIFLDM